MSQKLFIMFAVCLSVGCGGVNVEGPTPSQPMYNVTSGSKPTPAPSTQSDSGGASIRSANTSGESDPKKVCHTRTLPDNSHVLICETIE